MSKENGDSISRSEVLKLIDKYSGCIGSFNAFTMSRDIMDMESTNKWISVNEKLPEKSEKVLVDDGVDIFVAWYNEHSKKWRSHDSNYDYDTPIIAWQPLPEEYDYYKESNTEEKER